MSVLSEAITGAIKGVVEPVVGLFTKKVERKAAKDQIDGTVRVAKLNNEAQVAIQTADWEILSKAQEKDTWKDEYITLSVFSVFNAIILGSVAASFGFTGGDTLVDGVLTGVQTLDSLDGNVGDLMWMVAAAALSIKGWNALTK